jgi:hypothetical protein
MKLRIIVALLSISSSLLNAQTQENPHLMFKGVPIDGTLSEYVAKMKLNGFTVVASEPGMSMLQGDFAGYKDCFVGVVTMKQKDLVSRIKVLFPDREDWASLYGNYRTLKEMLNQKYGQPAELVEEFPSYPNVTDEGLKYMYAQGGECNYFTAFETPKGRVSLRIDNIDSRCFISLTYTDKINSEIMKANAIDDL